MQQNVLVLEVTTTINHKIILCFFKNLSIKKTLQFFFTKRNSYIQFYSIYVFHVGLFPLVYPMPFFKDNSFRLPNKRMKSIVRYIFILTGLKICYISSDCSSSFLWHHFDIFYFFLYSLTSTNTVRMKVSQLNFILKK